MALPPLTPEQRQAALDKAAASRRERAEVKNRLKNSGASIVDVLREGQQNEVIGKMRVVELLHLDEEQPEGAEGKTVKQPPPGWPLTLTCRAGTGAAPRCPRPPRWI